MVSMEWSNQAISCSTKDHSLNILYTSNHCVIPVTSDQSPASLFSVLHTMQVTHNSAEEPTPGDGRVHKERMERATDDETKN